MSNADEHREAATGIRVGATWAGRRKRDLNRQLFIREVFTGGDGKRYVSVRRNTSRRRQAISVAVLLKDYKFLPGPPTPPEPPDERPVS